MEIGLARVSVKNTFCDNCSIIIKQKITQETTIKNVYLYPENSTVVFSFTKANQISKVLNTLVALGYPEQGDRGVSCNFIPPFCSCIEQNLEQAKAS